MKSLTLVEQKPKNDCDLLIENFEGVLVGFNDCFETSLNDKHTKMNVVGSIFGFTKALTKLTFNIGYCAVKYTPKAIVTVAAVKREIVYAIQTDYKEHQLEVKKEALDKKIRSLQLLEALNA